MIQTIQLIKFCYPFILLAIFFCLYKKDNRITRKFCWRMTMTRSARKLFIIAVLALLILLNWCCYMTDPNWAVLFAAVVTCCLFSNRVADRVLHRLHERKRFWTLTLMLALICYSIPYMNSIFHVLYTLGVASRRNCFSGLCITTIKLPLVCGILSEHTCSKILRKLN